MDAFSEDWEPNKKLFSLLQDYLKILDSNLFSPLIIRMFEMKLLDCSGFLPELRECLTCRENLPPDKYRGHLKEFLEDELINLVQKYNFKLLASRPILPRPSLNGNLPFIIYRFLEYLFYAFTRPFVKRGYGNNHNMIFKKN